MTEVPQILLNHSLKKLLLIDELGFVSLSKTGAELLFEPKSQRYKRGSILITSNLPFEKCPKPSARKT